MGFLNLLPSTYGEVHGTCQPFESDWFVDGLLLNSVPEKSGHAGAVPFRIHRLEEKELLEKPENLFVFFNSAIASG